MLRMKRPFEMWSIAADCLAEMIGWLMVMCEVETTPVCAVEAEMPAAQV